MEHEVWARLTPGARKVYMDTYPQDQWQFALKYARRLRERGATDVEVRDVNDILEREDDPDDDEEE